MCKAEYIATVIIRPMYFPNLILLFLALRSIGNKFQLHIIHLSSNNTKAKKKFIIPRYFRHNKITICDYVFVIQIVQKDLQAKVKANCQSGW